VEEILESGEETYYPALHVDVGSKKSCAVVCMSLYCRFFFLGPFFSTHFYFIYTPAKFEFLSKLPLFI